jgi:hypothetical protein
VAALLGCTAPAPYFVAPGHEGAPGVRRVLLCAPNIALALPAEIASGAEPVHQELAAYLEGQGLEVEHLGLSEGRWRWERSGAEVDRQGSTGSADAAAAIFVKDMAERREFDVLIMPSLILRSVQVTDSSGTWDGVRRRVNQVNAPSMGIAGSTDTFTKGLAYGGISGDLMAASLHLAVFSPDGQRVFEGSGGLDFIQEADLMDARSRGWDLRIKRHPLRNPEVVREGVEIALAPYLPPRSER